MSIVGSPYRIVYPIPLIVCLALAPARAAVMSVDDAVFGVGPVTPDDVSGPEWLDLMQPTGRSFNDVSSRFGAGGDFEGWRYASVAEIGDFFTSAGGTPPHDGVGAPSLPWVTDLISLWGATRIILDLYTQSLAIAYTSAGPIAP